MGKPLFKYGRPVLRDGVPVFVEEGDAGECACCGTTGGPCETCIVGRDSLIVTIANTPDGTSQCTYPPITGQWPWTAYSWSGSYLLNERIDFSPTSVLFYRWFGTAGDADDPGRLQNFFTNPWYNWRTYLLFMQASVSCVDGDLVVTDVSFTTQTFQSSPLSDGVRVFVGYNSYPLGDAAIDTTADCCAAGETDTLAPWVHGCNAHEGDGPYSEGATTATVSMCGEFTNPDPPPDDPDTPDPEDPEPDPPPPDPPFDVSDCESLTECDAEDTDDGELAMTGWTDYDEAFAAGFVYTDLSGTRHWAPSVLNGTQFICPPDGSSMDYSLDIYTPGTYAAATAPGANLRVMWEEFDSGPHDPALTEVYVYKIEWGVSCADGRVRLEYITLHYEVFIGRADGDPGPTSNGTFSATFQDTMMADVLLEGSPGNCRFGPTYTRIEFDDDMIVPAAPTTPDHTFFAYAASESA